MQVKTNNAVFIIDPQYDFCHPDGALYVPGAFDDMTRLAQWIATNAAEVDFICCTMDQHVTHAIFHPTWFIDENGAFAPPFTQICARDVETGRWKPRYYPEETLVYLKKLEEKGGYTHTIWPLHCLIGSKGAAILDELFQVILKWEMDGKLFLPEMKGLHPLTEHYGVFAAEVSYPDAPETQINYPLLELLNQYKNIYFAGEAKSHCVAASLKQAMTFAPDVAQKFVIIEDCMSPVPGFESSTDTIFNEARERGIRFVRLAEIESLAK